MIAVAVAVIVGIGGAIAGIVAVASEGSEEAPTATATATAKTTPAAPDTAPPPKSTAPTEPTPPREPVYVEPDRPPLPIDVSWSGSVTTSSHPDVKKKAKCLFSLEGTLDPEGRGSEKTMRFSCGDTVLYDSTHPFSGMTRYGFGVGERPGENPGDWVYSARLSDTGSRSGRNLIELETLSKVGGKLTGSTGRDYEVTFKLDATSTPRQGSSLYDTPKKLGTMKRLVKVTASDGTAPASPGEDCALSVELIEVRGVGKGHCLASLVCNKTSAYPASKSGGFGNCTFDDEGLPLSFEDEKVSSLDGDASLSVTDTDVSVSDDPVKGRWSMQGTPAS